MERKPTTDPEELADAQNKLEKIKDDFWRDYLWLQAQKETEGGNDEK